MKLLLIGLFLSTLSHAKLPQDWMAVDESLTSSKEVSTLPQEDANSLRNIRQGHEQLLNQEALSLPGWKLDRFDVELGVNLKGEIGVLATGGQGAIELVWQRKNDRKEEEGSEDILLTTDDPEIISQELSERIRSFISFEKLSGRQRRKIIQILRKDAVKIGVMIREMASMPRVGNWYVSGFFKTYLFSAKGDILAAEVGYEKRIRFRFAFAGIPLRKSDSVELRGTQHFHHFMMKSLNQISRLENPQAPIKLRRVRARTEFSTELDLLLFSTSAGYSLQPVYMKVPDDQLLPEPLETSFETEKNSLLRPYLISEKITAPLRLSLESDFQLSQIRTKFSWRLQSGWGLATIDKNAVLELHFMRGNP